MTKFEILLCIILTIVVQYTLGGRLRRDNEDRSSSIESTKGKTDSMVAAEDKTASEVNNEDKTASVATAEDKISNIVNGEDKNSLTAGPDDKSAIIQEVENIIDTDITKDAKTNGKTLSDEEIYSILKVMIDKMNEA